MKTKIVCAWKPIRVLYFLVRRKRTRRREKRRNASIPGFFGKNCNFEELCNKAKVKEITALPSAVGIRTREREKLKKNNGSYNVQVIWRAKSLLAGTRYYLPTTTYKGIRATSKKRRAEREKAR